MSEWSNIGDILVNFGRVTQDHVKMASDYQRENGGYFGEALLALGFVSRDELEWALASQYDLPYVFPDADTIDPEAAMLVSPEWALAHLALPILKTTRTLTVIVDSPIRTEAVDELQRRTDLRIELALASGEKIRELVRQIFARIAASEDTVESKTPVSLREAFGAAMDQGVRRFGISTRGPRALVWYKEDGHVRRRPLDSRWKVELGELIDPSPLERTEGVRHAQWSGHLNQNGVVTPVASQFLASDVGSEYLFRPMRDRTEGRARFPHPSQEFLTEVRLLARSGSARFLVVPEPAEFGAEILPHLPALLLESTLRSVHISQGATAADANAAADAKADAEAAAHAHSDAEADADADADADTIGDAQGSTEAGERIGAEPGEGADAAPAVDADAGGRAKVFSVRLPEDRAKHSDIFLRLHPFGFDVVTANLPGAMEEWVTPLLNLAPCAFVLSPATAAGAEGEEERAAMRRTAMHAGIRWEMVIRRNENDTLDWALDILKGQEREGAGST